MGIEILETVQVHVRRPDRERLREVRDGLLPNEELLEMAADYEVCLEHLYATSPLPDEPDTEAADALVMELQEQCLWPARRST